ncbi:Undecaprenyl-phosphate 4-deoxy-4-formamido-L-arabinose transferase [Pseudobythopirellula maris]|uniref:Undecaprenyl-phosphate 4-deoxy-4-formamido-L-arabinose transferase n=1 Tax=Pseudobythopirellula maris TaxID=2527991 RepID=A0A5C5ZS37_9BACT|nr:glycosyltransferase family 2 protein [Pseudobythopirellula maris]TWT90110.1 Undecaprenyl-phosphate 4-deoxy-4-formamido-L-arabinose transferase [Pseudobythopirellula maris]
MPRPLTVVVPVLNESASLAELVAELRATAAANDYAMQIVLVDDGSTDGSWRTIQGLAAQDPLLEGVRFRRNFGKAAALSAGFGQAEHAVIVTMDADLQDNPGEIPKLLAALDGEGAGKELDVVSGWKVDRQDPWHKRWPSLAFNRLVSGLTRVRLNDHNCGLKAYRREVLDEVSLYGELHRFIPVLAASRGFRVGEVAVHHRPRKHGESKYGASRIFKGFLDLLTVKFLTRFGDRPQHLLGGVGLASFLAGAAGLSYLAVRWGVSRALPGMEPIHLHETAAMFYSIALCVVGSQFLSMGLIAELVASMLHREGEAYSIAEHVDGSEQAPAERPATDTHSDQRAEAS